MKISLIILLASLFWACNSENEQSETSSKNLLELSKNELKITNVKGSFSISIIASGDWKAEVEGAGNAWLTLSQTSGNGNSDLRLFFTENEDSEKRKGIIRVTLLNTETTLTQEISVEQLGTQPDILVDYSKESIPFQGGTFSCQVVSNVKWIVEIDEKYEWIKEAEQPALSTRSFSTDDVQFTISPNTGAERKGEITFKASGIYALSRTIEILQEEVKTTLEVEQDEYIIPYKMKSLIIPIIQEHPIAYEIISSESWITLDKEASNESSIVLKIEDNTDRFPRTSSVKIKNSVSDQDVLVFQYGKPDTSIGDDLSAGQLLAFPGAEGGGRFVTGGRGGEIYRVTNLKDYPQNGTPIKGSLRYGIEKSDQPRTIIFDVSGIIEMEQPMFIAGHPNVSIIGQTAPGDGITLKNYNLTFNLSRDNIGDLNTIIRFIRCRPGDAKADYGEDGIGGRNYKGAIIDHVTASWSVDETLTSYGVQNFTAQWCMASESLNLSNHAKGAHGYGGMFGGTNSSFHHILMAHHGSRCPRLIDGCFDMRNNVIYNWFGSGLGCYGGTDCKFNMVNCYYKAGPATGTGWKAWRIVATDVTARAYIDGNYMTANPVTTKDNWTTGVWDHLGWIDEKEPTKEEKLAMKMESPLPYSKVTTHSAETAYDKVLKYAGASLRRDKIDKRVVEEVRAGIAPHLGSRSENPAPGLIDTPSDVGGYIEVKSLKPWPDTDNDGIPDIWEVAYGLNPNNPGDANQVSPTVDPNGRYSNLEVYFHNLVQHIIYHQNEGGQAIEKM